MKNIGFSFLLVLFGIFGQSLSQLPEPESCNGFFEANNTVSISQAYTNSLSCSSPKIWITNFDNSDNGNTIIFLSTNSQKNLTILVTAPRRADGSAIPYLQMKDFVSVNLTVRSSFLIGVPIVVLNSSSVYISGQNFDGNSNTFIPIQLNSVGTAYIRDSNIFGKLSSTIKYGIYGIGVVTTIVEQCTINSFQTAISLDAMGDSGSRYLTVTNCAFNTNQLVIATSAFFQNTWITGSVISGNTAPEGSSLISQSRNISLTNVSFQNNVGILTNSYNIDFQFKGSGSVRNCTGGFHATSDGYFSGINFLDNQLTGPIISLGFPLSSMIVGCYFRNNTVSVGSLITLSGSLSVSYSHFSDNRMVDSQGSVIESKSPYQYLFINGGSTFSSNIALSGIVRSFFKVNVTDSTFVGNSGGVVVSNNECSVNRSLFQSNHAKDGNGGGAINSTTVIAESSTFDSNVVKFGNKGGGAIFAQDVVVINCIFTNNRSPKGGAISSSGSIVIISSTFNSNTASDYGAAAILDSLTASTSNYSFIVKNSHFFNNTARYKGAVYSVISMDVSNSEFFQNKGGAVSCERLCFVTTSLFKENSATGDSAVYSTEELVITSSDFNYNTVQLNGGALYSGTSASIDNCNFVGNSALNLGGAIAYRGNITVNSSSFDSNSFGAIVYFGMKSSNQLTIINRSVFINNQGYQNSAVYSNNTINTTNSRFWRNRARGIYSNDALYAKNCSFEENQADYGGAIFNFGSLILEDSSFTENFAEGSDGGGAVYHPSGNSVVINNCTFSGNIGKKGGAIFCSSAQITNSKFKENYGEIGAAIWSYSSLYFFGSYEGGKNYYRGGLDLSNDVSIFVSEGETHFENEPNFNCDWVQVHRVGSDERPRSLLLPQALNFTESPLNITLRRRDPMNDPIITDLQIGSYSCNVTDDRSSSIVCKNNTVLYGKGLKVMSSQICFIQPFYVNGEDLPVNKEDKVKEVINNIVKNTTESSISSIIYTTITSYFNSTVNATNPLVLASLNVSLSAFDVSRKEGNAISLSLGLYNSSTVFPVSVIDEILGQNETKNAFLIFTTYNQIQSQLSVAVPNQGSEVYGLSLVDEKGGVVRVANASSPIILSLALRDELTSEEVNDLECLFWSESEGAWKSDGCSRKSISAKVIECECYHLTNFSAGKPIVQRRSEAVVSPPNNKTSSFPIGAVVGAVVGGVVLLVIIAIVIVMILKRRSKQQISNIEMSANDGQSARRIVLGKRIGNGAFAIVYQAIDSGTTTVAVKRLNLKEDRNKFMREANTMKGLHHPNIVQYLDTYEDRQGYLCIVLEYVEKGTLLQMLQSEKQVFEIKLKIACDVAGALRYLESQKIIHNDISARNILIRDGPTAKLSDFGMAINMEDEKEEKERKGENKSPVRWTAPEVLMFQKYSPKSDVWMFGVLLWEIWTDGKMPYGEMTNEEVVQFVCKGGKLFPEKDNTHKFLDIIRSCNEEEHARAGMDIISSDLNSLGKQLGDKGGKDNDLAFSSNYNESSIYVGK